MKSQQQHVLKQIWSGSLTNLQHQVLGRDITKATAERNRPCLKTGKSDVAECATCCEDDRYH